MIMGQNRYYFSYEYSNGGTLEDKLGKNKLLMQKGVTHL